MSTWHKIEKSDIVTQDESSMTISVNFGKFWKCGFFDWRIYEISENGKFLPCEIIGKQAPVFPISKEDSDDSELDSACLAQGRFIVHARGIRDHSFHEVQVDY